jgi:hypothetical protein
MWLRQILEPASNWHRILKIFFYGLEGIRFIFFACDVKTKTKIS